MSDALVLESLFMSGEFRSVFPNEYEKIVKRDESVSNSGEIDVAVFESCLFEDRTEVTHPKHVSTKDLVYMLARGFSRMALHVEYDEKFKNVVWSYRAYLAKLIQGWSDPAILALARSFAKSASHGELLYKELKKWQQGEIQY